MRIMRALFVVMVVVAAVWLAGCGGGGGTTPPDNSFGTLTVDSTQQKVFYTPPSGRTAYSVYAYFRNTVSGQTITANFDPNMTPGKWTLDISPASTQFTGDAIGDYNMTTWVIFMDDDSNRFQVGSSILIPDLDILGGSGPPPPPWP